MSARARVWIVVGLAAVAAAGTVVGVTLATRSDVHRQAGKPPPFVADPTARTEVAQQVREALVQLELGLALAFSGQQADATRAWQAAERVQPDSPSAVRAQDLRHPGSAPGLPPFVPSFTRVTNVVQAHLLRGSAYQQALRPVSAEREFVAAVQAAPNDPEALTAAAVGLYDKDRPATAFSRLGPLVRRFPHAQTVRFHLGLLLIYFGDMPRARRELALARAQGPLTSLGKRAETLLQAGRNP